MHLYTATSNLPGAKSGQNGQNLLVTHDFFLTAENRLESLPCRDNGLALSFGLGRMQGPKWSRSPVEGCTEKRGSWNITGLRHGSHLRYSGTRQQLKTFMLCVKEFL